MNQIKVVDFTTLNKDKILFDIMELWNHEAGFIFPFYRELFKQKIFDCKFFSEKSSFLVYKDNKIIGFVISKIYDNDEIIKKYIDTGWISLIYVSEKERGKGIGTILLDKAEKSLLNFGVKKIMIGSDYNNFFPGIPNEFGKETIEFFRKNNYEILNVDYDVICSKSNSNVLLVDSVVGYDVRYASQEDKQIVLDFFKNNFYGRWYYEALEYFDKLFEEKTYLIAINKNKVVGFIRINRYNSKQISYNVNWNKLFEKLYGFGPLGVDKEHRGKGLARLLIETALKNSRIEGATDIIIDWTSLVSFYEKFGFTIWKSYTHAIKTFDL